MDDATQAMVYEVLREASSQDPQILKPAEAKLHEWQTQPGFYTALYNILINYSVEVNVRLMAVVCMKNGVEMYWRKNVPNAITEQEKEHIRVGLQSNFHEPVNQIAVHIAVLVSKIARIDWPMQWPALPPVLLQAVECTDPLVQHRALLTLHHVVKVMASKRLLCDKRAFHEFTETVYHFLLNLWNIFTEAFINAIVHGADVEAISMHLEKALLTLRALRTLTVYGFYKPNEHQDCMDFIKVVFDRARTTIECRGMLKSPDLVERLDKFTIHLTKVLISVQDTHPCAFIAFIKPSCEFVYYYLFASNMESALFERFIIQCFNLMKAILVCSEYKCKKSMSTEATDTTRASDLIGEFFESSNVVAQICRKLISHYFILSREDLAAWDADPEGFTIDESGETWKYNLRPSMECLYMALFNRFREHMTPIILALVRETNVLVPPEDMQGILKKDAVYNAVGLAEYNMYDEVDFDQWFANTLTQELKIKHNNYRILRRRVAWLIGQWSCIKLAPELRPAMYECCLALLDPQEDLAVRLTTSAAFRNACDDFDFNAEQFEPYMEATFMRLFELLKAAHECETKMQVLNVITLLITRCGTMIAPNSDALLQYLPVLWHEAEEHNMLRCGIVATFVQLVSIGCVSAEFGDFLVRIIKLGTDTTQGAILYLLEDSLELWAAVLQTTKTLTPASMGLFENILPLLEYSSEYWKTCLQIIQMYLLLDPEFFIVQHGVRVVTTFTEMMSDMRYDALLLIARLMEEIVCVSPIKGSEVIRIILPEMIHVIVRRSEPFGLLSLYLSVVSRVILASHDVFSGALRQKAAPDGGDEQQLLGALLDVWTVTMSNISTVEIMKLLGMALTNLLTVPSAPIVQRIPQILISISETLNDIMQTDENKAYYDSLVMTDAHKSSDEQLFETEHQVRESQLIAIDPVHNVVLKDYLQMQLNALQSQLGQSQYEQLMQTVDHNTITQLGEFVRL